MSFPFSIPEDLIPIMFPSLNIGVLDQSDPLTPQSPPPINLLPDEDTLPTFNVPLVRTVIENCTHDPQPEPGVFTLMGPLRHFKNKNNYDVIHKTILQVRKDGFIVNVVPNSNSPPSVADEYQYIKEDCLIENIKVFNPVRDTPVAYLNTRSGERTWINIRCMDRATKTKLLRTLTGLFTLASIEHKTCRFDSPHIPSEYYITVTTGNGPSTNENFDTEKQAVGSYFELKRDFGEDGKNKKVIGKAICAYSNFNVDMCGPTIEVLEIASEWQRRGLGSAFLKAIEKFFRDQFDSLHIAGAPVHMNCCNAIPYRASRWFQRKGFRDQGFGEELTRPLYDEDPDHLDDEYDEYEVLSFRV